MPSHLDSSTKIVCVCFFRFKIEMLRHRDFIQTLAKHNNGIGLFGNCSVVLFPKKITNEFMITIFLETIVVCFVACITRLHREL